MTTRHKRCCDCHDEKPLDQFHACSGSPDGRQYRCIPCRKAYDAKRSTKQGRVARAFRQWLGMTSTLPAGAQTE